MLPLHHGTVSYFKVLLGFQFALLKRASYRKLPISQYDFPAETKFIDGAIQYINLKNVFEHLDSHQSERNR